MKLFTVGSSGFDSRRDANQVGDNYADPSINLSKFSLRMVSKPNQFPLS